MKSCSKLHTDLLLSCLAAIAAGAVMQRITISLEDELAEALDAHVAGKGYANRSEAVRDLIREMVAREVAAAGDGTQTGIGILSYIFDHGRRDLARRLTHTHHDHHVMNLSTLHLHLDHSNCLEVAVLRGPVGEMRALADQVTAERGVAFGDLRLVADPTK